MKMRPFKIHFRHTPNSPSFFKPSKTHIFLLTFVELQGVHKPLSFTDLLQSTYQSNQHSDTHPMLPYTSLTCRMCREEKGRIGHRERQRDKDRHKESSNCENHHLILLCLIHLKIPNPNPKLSLNIKLMAHLTGGAT
jgi:hypothetical protein